MALPPPPSQPGGMARSLREKAGRLAAARQARGQAPGRDCYRLLRRAATLEAAQSLARPGRCDLEQAARQLAGALGALCPCGRISWPFSAPAPLCRWG